MPGFKDRIGDQYGRLTVISHAGKDHITLKSKGGANALSNLQFLTWFENRCKNNMSQQEWDEMKSNILEYFV